MQPVLKYALQEGQEMNTSRESDSARRLVVIRVTLLLGVVVGVLMASATNASAQYDRNRHGSPGMQQADRHNPFAQGGSSVYSNRSNSRVTIGGTFGFGFGYPSYGYPAYGYPGFAGYPPLIDNPYYYGSYSPYLPYYRTRRFRGGSYMLPPVVLPAETLFGPAAAARFFNGGNPAPVVNNPPVIINVNGGGNAVPANANANVNERGEPKWAREVTLAMRERAWRFIEMGDRAFIDKDYRAAIERYRGAARAAPRIVEAYLKQAQAMIALERYDAALEAYNRALALPPLWVTANFSLTEQYGPEGQELKTAHLDQLAAAAEKDPNNADLLLLIGMELFYDQQPERAVNFLRRAKELGAQGVDLPADAGNVAPGNAAPGAGVPGNAAPGAAGAAAGQGGDDAPPIPNPPPVGKDRRIF